MAYRPWNFQCWQDTDWGAYEEDTGGYVRGRHGGACVTGRKMGWRYNDPGNSDWNLWFVNYGTFLFSFCIRSGDWTAQGNEIQYLMCAGVGGDATNSYEIRVKHDAAGDSRFEVRIWDRNTATWRYLVFFGDEDGINWLSTDKWYQCAVSVSETAIQVGVNGSITPKKTVTTDAPGSLNWSRPIESGVGEMMSIPGTFAFSSSTNFLIWYQPYWSTLVRGPLALDTTVLDLSQESVRDRIWDEQGNFKFPGENGCLWFQDSYDEGAAAPRLYWPDGSGRRDQGANPGRWIQVDGGSSGSHNQAGGMRAQYE